MTSPQRKTVKNLAPCPDCGNEISLHATACPACGRPLRIFAHGRRLTVVVLALSFFGLCIYLAILYVNDQSDGYVERSIANETAIGRR